MDFSRLNQKQLAKAFGKSARTIQTWTDQGMPRNGDDSYSLPDCSAWSNRPSDSDFDDQRERLAAAQAEKVETENAVRRGQLAVVADFDRVQADHVAAARARLLSMATKLAPQLTGISEPNVIAAAVRAEVTAALAELAEYEPPPVEGGDADVSEDVAAAPVPDGKPMGRRPKKAEQRV
jgi:hypothetical protein